MKVRLTGAAAGYFFRSPRSPNPAFTFVLAFVSRSAFCARPHIVHFLEFAAGCSFGELRTASALYKIPLVRPACCFLGLLGHQIASKKPMHVRGLVARASGRMSQNGS